MRSYRDVELRILARRANGANGVEVRLDGSGGWSTESRFDLDALPDSPPMAYGKALGEQLATPVVLRALDRAGLDNGYVRLRLRIDDDSQLHGVRWERLWLTIGGTPQILATNPRFAFSRYIPVEQPDETPSAELAFRLLYAVSNPKDLEESKQIAVNEELSAFLQAFEDGPVDRRIRATVFPGRCGVADQAVRARIERLGWAILDGCATVDNIGRELGNGYHGLHILAHGDFSPATETGLLLLEDENGGMARVPDHNLQSWITPSLQLVLLQACRGAAPSKENGHPFVSLAPKLIRLGVPAAIAMQDVIEMDDARRFFGGFYRTLLDEGIADVAVNRGRQRLIDNDQNRDSWSIPTLFSRLIGGKVWAGDPWRQALLDNFVSLEKEAVKWPPLGVIEHSRGLTAYEPLAPAEGPRFDLWTRCSDLAAAPDTFVVLTGPAGSFRAAQLQTLFIQFAKAFLASESEHPPLPVSLSISELAGGATAALPILKRFWTGETNEEEVRSVSGRRLLFLVDAEDEIGGLARERALDALDRLMALPGSSIVVLASETLLPELAKRFSSPVLLVAQKLVWTDVESYLTALKTDVAQGLLSDIRNRAFADLASHPRFLQHMLELAARKVPLRSRGAVLSRIADIYIARSTSVPSSAIEESAGRIAWAIYTGRGAELPAERLYPVLAAARGDRDFGLSALITALTSECRLLMPTVNEGVRFAYPLLQSYFAARHLATLPDRQNILEDITASLGRLARLRRWEQMLVLVAGMVDDPARLLRTILAGSSLLEGDQLFLAVCCYQEAIERSALDNVTVNEDLKQGVAQIVDTLMWRSSWDPTRTYADRQRAVVSLISLLQSHCEAARRKTASDRDLPPWTHEVIEHLVSLACDPVPDTRSRKGPPKYDWAGIRRAAADGLLQVYDMTSDYVSSARGDLLDPLNAWWKLQADPSAMTRILETDDARFSVIAAFALATSPAEQVRLGLVKAYDGLNDEDVLWAITTALGTLDAAWLHTHVIEPWLEAVKTDLPPRGLRRATHVCYLVQKTSLASPAVRDVLWTWLRDGSPPLQGRVVRALSKLGDRAIEATLRTLCERILTGRVADIDQQQMRVSDKTINDPSLRRASIEALRDIGDIGSMETVRATRAAHHDSPELRQLSFQVVEEMYWRLNGGLERDTFARPSRS